MNVHLDQYLKQKEDSCILDKLLYVGCIHGQDRELPQEMTCKGGFFFLLVSEGNATLCDLQNNTAVIGKNDLISVSPVQEMSIKNFSGDYSMFCLMLDSSFFYSLSSSQYLYGKLCEFTSKSSFPLHLKDNIADYLRKIIGLFHDSPDENVSHKEGIYRHLCDSFMLYVRDMLLLSIEDAYPSVSQRNIICNEFKKLLFEYYRQEHRISFYAERLAISGAYLSRVIREETGQTVYDHISELLYSDAKKMLSCSSADIQNITYTLGFNDQASFSKFFKRLSGLSPKEYRNRDVKKSIA